VNVCAPENADVNALIAALALAFHRPAVLRVPAPALRLVMGQLADELILPSQRMEPAVLSAAGFAWQHPSLAGAAAWVAGKH
jgi:NAD dependent epimerase/dehydratase family enzyme